MNVYLTSTWSEVTGVVIKSTAKSHQTTAGGNNNSTSYSVDIIYEYMVSQKVYRNSNIYVPVEWLFIGTGSWEKAIELTRRYAEGMKIKVYYDPENFGKSVLLRNVHSNLYIPLLIFFIVFITSTYVLLFIPRNIFR